MLFVLHICLLLISYDSSDMGLGEIETIVLCSQFREIYCELSLGKFDFYWINHLIVPILGPRILL